jgi:hypothetical protein
MRALPNTVDLVDTIRKRDGNREARLQADIVAWLRQALPNGLVFAVWNGGDLITKAEAAKRRWMGVLAGVADVVVVATKQTLFIEVKTSDGLVSLEQRQFGLQAQALGHSWAVARSIDDVRRTLVALGIEFINTEEAAE